MASEPSTYKALLVREKNKTFIPAVEELPLDSLEQDSLLVEVEYSSLNYKDALSASGNRGVTRSYPHVPGIDAAGIVRRGAGNFQPGDAVIVTGYDLGMNTSGGFGQYIGVPAEWAMPLPESMTTRQAMQYGTAGLTAALCIKKLLDCGISPAGEPVLVTGATGGVGSIAVAILSKLGARVSAVTTKAAAEEFLRHLGAVEVLPAADFAEAGPPLQKAAWSAAVDVAGGQVLANVLARLQPDGACACCGLVADAAIPATVLPFILRGVSLLGVDSVEIPLERKRQTFVRLAEDWWVPQLDNICTEIGLEGLPKEIERILAGGQQGRVLVSLKD